MEDVLALTHVVVTQDGQAVHVTKVFCIAGLPESYLQIQIIYVYKPSMGYPWKKFYVTSAIDYP